MYKRLRFIFNTYVVVPKTNNTKEAIKTGFIDSIYFWKYMCFGDKVW